MLLAVSLASIVAVSHDPARAQSFQLDLERYHTVETAPWDTVGTPIDRLSIGPYPSTPNFLSTDFERERVIEEYSSDLRYRVVFRVPPTLTFQSREVRDGLFILQTERPVGDPDVEVSIDSMDDIVRARYSESLRDTWMTEARRSIAAQDEEVAARKGMLNISIPVSLPGAVEKIIGQGEKTNIDISGRESITFEGETRRVSPFYGVEGQQKQPLFPSLGMKQELDVRLNGQIGEKINIQVDHTSSSLMEGQNRIRLNYTGFEDDIIKLIELGNTSLSLPGSGLVSFSASSKGLFGIKTLAQMGPVDMTLIASKEEGEVSRASFSPRGGQIGQTEERTIYDKDYVKNTYFFLDRPPDDEYPNRFSFVDADFIPDVYRSVPVSAAQTENTTWARAYVDSLGNGSGIGTGESFPPRRFKLLNEIEDFRYVTAFVVEGGQEVEKVIGIELVQSISSAEILAVAYVNERGDTIGDYRAPFSSNENTPLNLELIWPAEALPTGPYGYTWAYMMRNIYNLGLSNIDPASLDVQIREITNRLTPENPDSSDVPWIQIFGLDQKNLQGADTTDARIDLTTGLINTQRGTLTFPALMPFDPDPADVEEWTRGRFAFTGRYANLVNPALYTKLPSDVTYKEKFALVVKAASTTRTFRIDAFNITEGSEVVTVDGRTLQRNQDYKINYDTGEVELLGDQLLTPTSNITIDYEYKPFAVGGSSTLLGFNSIWNLSRNSRLGTTWLYESKASPTDRPRLGEEPTKAVVGGLDANLQYEPDFLTSLVNLLPLVETDAKSSFNFSGGMAVSFPDPNTNGQAFIDDMEGVEDSDQLTLTRRNWVPASPPVRLDDVTKTETLPAEDRAKVYWYNIEPEKGVHRRDLNPDLDVRESTLLPSLDIEFDTIPAPEDTAVWGGVMTGFRGGLDLTQGQFVEIWINDFQPSAENRKGVIYLDLGYIDEDFYEPDANALDQEDADFDGFTMGGENNEDTGLDGVPTGAAGDDPDDDYSSQRFPSSGNRFIRINGTEANGLPDTEDLDGSTTLDQRNAYFTFEIDLSDTAVIDIRRDFPAFTDFTDELDSWRLYRINLSDYVEVKSVKDGAPTLQQIKYARIWLRDIPSAVHPDRKRIQVTELKIVGNRWEKDGIRDLNDKIVPDSSKTFDPRFALGVISNKTDPGIYVPPRQVEVQNDISEKEQSLLIEYQDIEPGMGWRIFKEFAGSGLDLSTTYQDVFFLVHTDKFDPDVEYFMRLGFDSLTYYEVSFPLIPEYFAANNWIACTVSLSDLTSLKTLSPDSVVTGTAPDLSEPWRVYNTRMVGRPIQPSLFSVRYIYSGIYNKSDRVISGSMWLNDIFLGNRRTEADLAERLTASLSMGNIVTLSGAWQQTGAEYVPFGQRRGSGADARSISLSGKTNVEYFVPLFGFSVPLGGTFTQNTSLPKYMPSSDTEITQPALRDSMKTESSTRGFSANLSRSNSKNPLLKYTFDKLKANYAMSQSRQRSPAGADTTLTMQGTLDYAISFQGGHRVRLFKDFGFRYLPNSLNLRVNANRQTGQRYRNVGGRYVADPDIWNAGLTNFGSMTYVPFPSLTSSFRLQTQRDLKLPHEWNGIDIGTEIGRNHAFQATYRPPPVWLIRAFNPDLSYNSGYNEDSSPNVRKEGDPSGTRNVSSSREISAKVGFDLGRYLGRAFDKIGLAGEEGKTPERRPPGAPPGSAESPGEGQAPEGGAGADSVQAPSKPRVDALSAVRKVADVFSSIRKINASIQQGAQTGYNRVPGAPSLAYQLGFTPNSGVSFGGQDYDQPENNREDLRLLLDSGVQLTRNIDIAGRFSRGMVTSTYRGAVSKTRSMAWPDLSVSWKGLETFGPFRDIFQTASATITYNKTMQETEKNSAVESKRESQNLTPSVVFQWKNDLRSTVGVQYTSDKTDTRGTTNENSTLNVNFDLKYTFTPGKALSLPLPFLRNKTLKSRLDTSLSARYNKTGGRRSSGEPGRFVSTPGTSLIGVSPRVTYNFSSALNGSFFIDFARSYSDATDQTTTMVKVGLTATFTF